MQPAVAEPTTLAGKGAEALPEVGMLTRTLWLPLYQGARNPDQPAGTAPRQPMLLLDDRHRLPSHRRRHQFFASRPLSAWLSSIVSAKMVCSQRTNSA